MPHVHYDLCWMKGRPFSRCPNLVTKDTEMIPAFMVMNKRGTTNLADGFVKECADHALDVRKRMDMMLTMDCITGQTDRHLNNFGILRDPDTLEWIDMIPLYDNGGCFDYDRGYGKLTDGRRIQEGPACRIFAETFDGLMSQVSSLDWLEADLLRDVPAMVEDEFSKHRDFMNMDERERGMDTDRVHLLVENTELRLGAVARRLDELRP